LSFVRWSSVSFRNEIKTYINSLIREPSYRVDQMMLAFPLDQPADTE
jgi:hypothetical protein